MTFQIFSMVTPRERPVTQIGPETLCESEKEALEFIASVTGNWKAPVDREEITNAIMWHETVYIQRQTTSAVGEPLTWILFIVWCPYKPKPVEKKGDE